MSKLPEFGTFVPKHRRDQKSVDSSIAKATENKEIPNPDSDALCLAMGLFDYTATDSDELTFSRGDEIVVMSKIVEGEDEGTWWEGYLKSDPEANRGMFPANRVHQLLEYEGVRYMLTQENEVFTLDDNDGEAEFVGVFDREKHLITVQDENSSTETIDWAMAKIL